MKYFISFFLFLIGNFLNGQSLDYWGNEFWVPNVSGTIIIETNGVGANVTFEDIASGNTNSVFVPANSLYSEDCSFSSSYTIYDNELVWFSASYLDMGKAIYVNSDVPVTMRYIFKGGKGGGASNILPENSLSTSYTISTYKIEDYLNPNFAQMLPFALIVATENNTTIKIKPTQDTDNGFIAGITSTISLNRGDIFPLTGLACYAIPGHAWLPFCGDSLNPITNDLSGTKIYSDGTCAPFSVVLYYNAHYIGGYPNNAGCCADAMMENCFPEKYWGDSFWVMPEQHTVGGNMVRILSKTNNTKVYVNGNHSRTLSINEPLDTMLFSPSLIETNHPSFVSQFFLSAHTVNSLGDTTDPEMMFIPPNRFQVTKGRFDFSHPNYSTTAPDGTFKVTIFTNTSNIGNITVNGVGIPASNFSPLTADPTHSWAYLDIAPNTHEIASSSGSFQCMYLGNSIQGSIAAYLGSDTLVDKGNLLTNDTICSYMDTITLKASNLYSSYLWSTGDVSDTALVWQPGIYSVEGYDNCGDLIYSEEFLVENCDTAIIVNPIEEPVNVSCSDEELIFTNVFTPNGDGINDFFKFQIPFCFSDPHMKIYNRWGILVFETEQIEDFWDGRTTAGSVCPEGTFYWIFDVKDGDLNQIRKTGYVSLLH